jgi:hypothetical protein
MTITGVRPDQIGDTYDVALGYPDPVTGDVRMVGYSLANGGTWQESTNLQDEEHLVQIASPSSSDRFGRYPQVSQGDWSGGERQLIFVTGNEYYMSTQLNTSIPGHLTINGNYTSYGIPNGVVNTSVAPGTRNLALGNKEVFFIGSNGATQYISAVNLNSGAVYTQALTSGEGVPSELCETADFQCYMGTTTGIWGVVGGGASITFTQATNDPVAPLQGSSMAVFAGQLWYITGTSTPNAINSLTYPLPGAAGGTTEYTAFQMEHLVQSLGRGANGLVFMTGGTTGLTWNCYEFDGVNATLIGRLTGHIQDITEANGTVYILAYGSGSTQENTPLPIIYSVSGSTVSKFDDFRVVDSAFWPISFDTNGRLDSDGLYLYFWTSGLSAKRYSLTTSAITDVGNPACVVGLSGARSGCAIGDGSFMEIESGASTVTAYLSNAIGVPNVNGVMTTSWFDFDVPGVRKAFSSIEFTMNSDVDLSALLVSYQTDASAGFQNLNVTTSLGGDKLICYLNNVIATRIQFRIVLLYQATSGPPDIAAYSLQGKLTRVWQFQVACRSQQQTRAVGHEDPQGLTSEQLLANIQNAYDLASGNVVLYIPDPAIDEDAFNAGNGVALGVSQINAVLQDFQWTTTSGVSPGLRQANGDGPQTMEGDVLLVLAGSL